MDIEQFRRAGHQAIDRICTYYYTLEGRPVISSVEMGYLKQHIPSTAPPQGEDFQVIADDYEKFIIPGLTHWQHPSFFAYFPCGASFEGILGDLYASAVTNPGFNWTSSPACTELESIVIDWAGQLLGLSSDFLNTSGALQTTADDSSLIAIVAARSRYQHYNPEVPLTKLVIYITTQTHSLGAKAGLVLGLSVRTLPVKAEDNFSLRGETLRLALEEDARLGMKPFVLIASVGTTSSGAVDNLSEIQQVVMNYHPSLWVHVDAAWAGVALACPEYREKLHLREINGFINSFCTNFHKWGLVNLDVSTLWVRDRRQLLDAMDVTPPFLRTAHGDSGKVLDYRNWHLGLSRRFRSLKLWFVLRSYGVEGFRSYIRKTISLSYIFVDFVSNSDILSLVTPPSLALSVFRLHPKEESDLSLEALNDLNKSFFRRLSARHDISLTQTVLNGVFCIRFAVGCVRTEKRHIQQAFKLIHEEADLTLKAWEKTTKSDTSTNFDTLPIFPV